MSGTTTRSKRPFSFRKTASPTKSSPSPSVRKSANRPSDRRSQRGADRAVRVWDDSLGRVDLLDVNAKTEILSAVIEAEDPDLVLTGVQAGDDSFAATGFRRREPRLPVGAVANHLEHDLDDGVASVRRELEGGVDRAHRTRAAGRVDDPDGD